MQRELGFSTAELTGAFSLALLVSAAAGIAVGRFLDRHGPRGLMTVGSIAATALVIAWAQVEGLAGLYLLWAAIGLVMANVLDARRRWRYGTADWSRRLLAPRQRSAA